MILKKNQLINVLLTSQGLLSKQNNTVTNIIKKICLLQIDTINVINRSPYVVLWSRLGNYEPSELDKALEDKQIFEYWAHAACFIPISDYPIFRRIQLSGANNAIKYFQKWIPKNKDGVKKILKYVEKNGEVMSKDFKRTDGKSGDWWGWKFEKMALEALFATGELMVSRRENFHRVYTLREKLLPGWNDSDAPPIADVIQEQLENGLKALGVAKLEWIKDYYRPNISKSEAYKIYNDLIKKSTFLSIEVEGFNEPLYYHKDHQEEIERILSNQVTNLPTNKVAFLSPFDPIVWDRSRLKEMFDFDYQIECYTPEAKRKYGYFTLPILYGTKMIGRFDAKAHRKDGIFEVKSLHFKKDVIAYSEMKQNIRKKFQEFAYWHNTENLNLLL